ncbi:MAG: hypothetical protein QOF90_577 [Acetobacteraceae bacterium]|nr:hypothetical protein [Acetobacteraceae bacterium]
MLSLRILDEVGLVLLNSVSLRYRCDASNGRSHAGVFPCRSMNCLRAGLGVDVWRMGVNLVATVDYHNAIVKAEPLTPSRHFGSAHLLALAGDDYNWRSHVTASDVILDPAAEITVTHI